MNNAAKHILVVDDEPAVRRTIQVVLSFYLPDFTVDVASNGAEALESFRKSRQGILLLDLQMPVMDGVRCFEELEKLCGNDGTRMPAVIFCTAYAPSDRINRMIAKGPRHGLIQKPMSNELLVEEIRKRTNG